MSLMSKSEILYVRKLNGHLSKILHFPRIVSGFKGNDRFERKVSLLNGKNGGKLRESMKFGFFSTFFIGER